jgi:hypothetical protein
MQSCVVTETSSDPAVLICRAKGLQYLAEGDPMKGDTVWVTPLSREAVVSRVVGDFVDVQPMPLQNAANDVLGLLKLNLGNRSSSRRAGYGLRYKKGDVKVLSRAGEYDQGEKDV